MHKATTSLLTTIFALVWALALVTAGIASHSQTVQQHDVACTQGVDCTAQFFPLAQRYTVRDNGVDGVERASVTLY